VNQRYKSKPRGLLNSVLGRDTRIGLLEIALSSRINVPAHLSPPSARFLSPFLFFPIPPPFGSPSFFPSFFFSLLFFNKCYKIVSIRTRRGRIAMRFAGELASE